MTPPVITVPAFATPRSGVRHFFGTRLHSADLPLEVGVPVRETSAGKTVLLLSVKQVHGTDALVVDRPIVERDRFEGGWDALVTDQPGIMVAVRTADCVPVLMHNRKRGVVAAIHAGWRGALAGIVPKTIDLLAERFDADPSSLSLSIGPSAGPCCYEVDQPVLDQLRDGFSEWQQVIRDRRGAKAKLDLRHLIRRQALLRGVAPDRVTSVNLCTICHGDLFYSYRREGRVQGTMVSGIALVPSSSI